MPNKGVVNNPKGKGGFKDNPQNMSGGMWSKDTSISYWYNKLIRMDLTDFETFEPKTMAQQLALNAVIEAKGELNYLKEVTDRTEGKAQQATDITTNGKEIQQMPTKMQIEIVKPLTEDES